MKKNNTAQKTALEAQKISKALREATEKSLKDLIKEAISDMVDDDDETQEEEPIEDDSFEVQDVETEETPKDADTETPEDSEEATQTEEPEDGAVDGDEADDEWSDLEQYKVGDNDYDFTGVDGETALKVYNKLGDDDKIFVQKQEDGTYEVKDEESGAEFVIELEPEEGEETADADTQVDTDVEPEGDFDAEPEEGDDDEIEIELDGDDEEELNEDLGYTDSYQKDVFSKKFNMSEPAKDANDWDAGAPKGGEKPWAGKGDMKPFEKTVNEGDEKCCPKCGKNCADCKCGEQELDESGAARTSVKKSHVVKGDKEKPEGFPARGPQALNEEKVRKIVEAAKAIQAENKKYQEVIGEIKKSLYEAAILNMNYGKIVNLLVNETTTKAEKQAIVERFSNVKTINEGKQLYDTIKRELNESTSKNSAVRLDEQISAESSKTINETKIFQNHPSISLMERMDNLYKKPMK